MVTETRNSSVIWPEVAHTSPFIHSVSMSSLFLNPATLHLLG